MLTRDPQLWRITDAYSGKTEASNPSKLFLERVLNYPKWCDFIGSLIKMTRFEYLNILVAGKLVSSQTVCRSNS